MGKMDGNIQNNVFNELIKKQRKSCKENKKLTLQDIRRISKNIKTSIFDTSGCSLWDGYITNKNKESKSSYINFYFRHRKVALHRLLYENYVSDIEENQYIKYNCKNKGICCNINHMYTIENEINKNLKNEDEKDKNDKKNNKKKKIHIKSKDKSKEKKSENEKLVVKFD